MTDIKPYLKYCIGRIVTIKRNDEKIIGTGNLSYLGAHLYANESEYTIIPHMRKMESLTEQEAIELIKKGYSPEMWDRIDITEMCKYHIEYTDGLSWHGDGISELNEFILYYNQLSPAQFHYLTTIGIAWWATTEMWEKGSLIEVKP